MNTGHSAQQDTEHRDGLQGGGGHERARRLPQAEHERDRHIHHR